MSPADHAHLCSFHSKMLCPLPCHYNYFIRDYRWTCFHTISRLKPRFPESNHVPDKLHGLSLGRLHSNTPTTYLRHHHLPLHPSVSALSRDKEDIVGRYETESLPEKSFFDDLIVDSGYYFGNENTISDTDVATNYTERYQPVEEPWLLLPYGSFHHDEEDLNAPIGMMDGNGALKKDFGYTSDSFTVNEKTFQQGDLELISTLCFSDREQPVEDPWLLYPTLESSQPVGSSAIGGATQDEQNLHGLEKQHPQVTEKLLTGRESHLVPHEGSVSTEILINCSVCTMQRIAVLEDGNLVELLLEPVKNNVQCDSVYLGVVNKLVPHMGGAFVNIGSSRPSLMDIKNKKEPFIFPPFGSTTHEKNLNVSTSKIVEKHSNTCEVKQVFLEEDDAGLSDDDAEIDFEDDDFEEHENEDDMEVEQVKMRDSTNCIVNDDGTGANVRSFMNQLNGNGNHAKAQSGSCQSLRQGHKKSSRLRGADSMWALVRKGTKIVVQVVKEGLGTKGPTLTAYPKLRSRFWILLTRSKSIGVSKKISGVERTRLRVIAKSLQPPGFGVTVRTVAAGHSVEELRKDLEGLLMTWKSIMEHAKSAALAADEGVEGAVPVILHQAMGQTLSVVQDYFSEKVNRMVVDSPRTYHEVTSYLQDIAPDLCDRVELHKEKVPIFDEFKIEEEINNILNKRVPLPNGGSLVIEQTEALVSIDVNGGHGMFGQGVSQEKAILDVNLAAAKQIARELRLRDIGGIIVVDFIDMMDDSNKRLVYEEVKKAVERDRSMVKVSELSKHGLMEITRKRVRPSVTFMISEPCTCCHGTGRVEALETSFSKIEHEICGLLATMDQKADPENPKSWPRLLLRVDSHMCDYLTSGKRTRLATLSSSLKVWILLKVARSFTRGAFELKLLPDNNQHQIGVAMLSLESETSISTKRTKLFPIKKWKAGRN